MEGSGEGREKLGLVLEGGGMRGLYTSGVLDCFMDRGVTFDYCIGVSAGACNAVSYVSGQRGRSRRINIGYAGDRRYLSVENLLREGSLFGMDFLFEEIPERLDPFDYEAMAASPCELVVGVTDVRTGRPVYFGKEDLDHTSVVVRASSSIPCFAPPVAYKGGLYLDGGTSDPIPIRKAAADGCARMAVVLTRDRAYRKGPEKLRPAYHRLFRDTPAMAALLDRRHDVYNRTLAVLRMWEEAGTAAVIAPRAEVRLGRFEKSAEKLSALYDDGYADAERFLADEGKRGFYRR